jgi:SsrA-binding protein
MVDKKPPPSELVSNRKAGFNYEILETFEAGIALLGTEIKSLRNHGGSLQDAFVDPTGPELWLLNSSIAPYTFGNLFNHEERRPRKLLMHTREIERLRNTVKQKGLSIIPLSIYLNKKGKAKVKIATAKGKKSYDKRAALKERDDKRTIQQSIDS